MASVKTMRNIAFGTALVIGTLVALWGIRLVEEKAGYTEFMERLGKPQKLTFKESPINPAWVVSGSPICRSKIFDSSHDKWSSTAGIWECQGPAKFDYHYGQDEGIYILAGAVEIEYLGKKFSLGPGDTTYFAAGTKATWTVHEHVRKAFRFQDPGRPVRYMRRLMQ